MESPRFEPRPRTTSRHSSRMSPPGDANLHVVDALTAPPERIDVALIRPARTLAMLEHQLRSLAPSLHSGSVVVSSSMVKHLHTSTLEVFERVLGPTTT